MLFAVALAVASLADAPVSLTTADGTGLAITSLDVDAVCSGPLCFTELRLSFQNPEDRVIEGQFQIALPPGASVSRFAMKIDDRWQEAEVVEKQAARRAYEDFLHRKQDPALLEQAAGNQFQARVFPIPARGEKHLIVSYGHVPDVVDGAPRYRFPLVGLPQIKKLKVRLRDGQKVLTSMEMTGVVPNADIFAVLAGARAVRAEDVVVARVVVGGAGTADASLAAGVVVLVDTSASRALQMPKDIALIKEFLTPLGDVPVRVVAFDQTAQEVFAGKASAFDAKALGARRALGATDLNVGLHAAANAIGAARRNGHNIDRIVLVSDGVVTADIAGGAEGMLQKLKSHGVRRVDAIVRGGIRDEAALAAVVAGGKERGLVVDGDVGARAILAKLKKGVLAGVAVDVKGAAWVHPRALDSVQPGDVRVIVAELKAGTPLAITLGGAAVDVGGVDVAAAPLLRRAWAEARIARLEGALAAAKSDGEKKELKEQIVAVSTRHRVLSSQTALLVLETEADYARFGIARTALADILVVDAAGVSVVRRADFVAAKPPPPPEKRTPSKAKAKKPVAAKGEADGMADLKDASADKSEPAPASDVADGAKQDEDDADGDVEKKVAEREPSPAEAPRPAPRADRGPPPPPAPPPPPPSSSPSPSSPSSSRRSMAPQAESVAQAEPEQTFVNPWTGPFNDGMQLLKKGDRAAAIKKARAWREEQPGDVLALFLLAEAYGDVEPVEAARALGAIIDLFPGRTDLRRAVGARLDALRKTAAGNAAADALSRDTWKKSVEQRADHPQSHRGLAWSLVRAGKAGEAFVVAEAALVQQYRSGGFAGVDRILRDDLGLIAAAWKAQGGAPNDLDARVKKAGGVLPSGPSLRFVLWWETDANDVDFHIRDSRGNHAYYSQPTLASGGSLYADVTTGYGPECFAIEGKPTAAPYKLSAHYYSRGPMGFGMGTLLVVAHDGKGGFAFEDRPFIIMVDGAFVDLGVVKP